MIKFLFLGLIRDAGRSRLPIIVVAIGVMLSVFLHAYVTGLMSDTIEMNAKFNTGHVKVMTKAYADNINQIPNDLSIIGVDELLGNLNTDFPDMQWVPRIKFGGLIDAPDENGETRSQGPSIGFGLDLLSKNGSDAERLNLQNSLVQGGLPQNPGEVLLSDEFAKKLDVKPGDDLTLIGSTMNGSMAMYNFKLVGTVQLGASMLDRGSIIADIEDVKLALNMPDAAGEVLGFFRNSYFDEEKAGAVVKKFNAKYFDENDEYSTEMFSLKDQGDMSLFVDLSKSMTVIITMIFMFAMSLVLWNAGLLGGLRRYGEIGIRLAIGENKTHVYLAMIIESIMIGIIGSIIGTAVGLFFAFLLEKYGIDISSMMKGASVMLPAKIRAHITITDFYIGFYPGIISTVLGTALSGIGIYKRKTAQLFKELEV